MPNPSLATRFYSSLQLALGGLFAVALTVLVPQDHALALTSSPPYGPLWFLLNPFHADGLAYRVWLAVFEGIALTGMVIAHSRWGLPSRIGFLQVLVLALFSLTHWHQNITVISFAWAIWYSPWFIALTLQKFPIGWSWDLSDLHWDCFRNCVRDSEGVPVSVLNRDVNHWFAYGLLVLVTVWPMVDGLTRRFKRSENRSESERGTH